MPTEGVIASNMGQSGLFSTNQREAKQLVSWVSNSIGRGGRIISESGAAMIRVGIVRAESCANCRAARKFPHELVMRKPSERPAVYGSGCEGVPEAKRLAG